MVDVSRRHRMPNFREQFSSASSEKPSGPHEARRNLQPLELYPYWPWERMPRRREPDSSQPAFPETWLLRRPASGNLGTPSRPARVCNAAKKPPVAVASEGLKVQEHTTEYAVLKRGSSHLA
jgi:hypothetical protein